MNFFGKYGSIAATNLLNIILIYIRIKLSFFLYMFLKMLIKQISNNILMTFVIHETLKKT